MPGWYRLRWKAKEEIQFLKEKLGVEPVRPLRLAAIGRVVQIAYWVMALLVEVMAGLAKSALKKLYRGRVVGAEFLLYRNRHALALFCEIPITAASESQRLGIFEPGMDNSRNEQASRLRPVRPRAKRDRPGIQQTTGRAVRRQRKKKLDALPPPLLPAPLEEPPTPLEGVQKPADRERWKSALRCSTGQKRPSPRDLSSIRPRRPG